MCCVLLLCVNCTALFTILSAHCTLHTVLVDLFQVNVKEHKSIRFFTFYVFVPQNEHNEGSQEWVELSWMSTSRFFVERTKVICSFSPSSTLWAPHTNIHTTHTQFVINYSHLRAKKTVFFFLSLLLHLLVVAVQKHLSSPIREKNGNNNNNCIIDSRFVLYLLCYIYMIQNKTLCNIQYVENRKYACSV